MFESILRYLTSNGQQSNCIHVLQALDDRKKRAAHEKNQLEQELEDLKSQNEVIYLKTIFCIICVEFKFNTSIATNKFGM